MPNIVSQLVCVQLQFIRCHIIFLQAEVCYTEQSNPNSYPSFSSVTWVITSSLMCHGSSYNKNNLEQWNTIWNTALWVWKARGLATSDFHTWSPIMGLIHSTQRYKIYSIGLSKCTAATAVRAMRKSCGRVFRRHWNFIPNSSLLCNDSKLSVLNLTVTSLNSELL